MHADFISALQLQLAIWNGSNLTSSLTFIQIRYERFAISFTGVGAANSNAVLSFLGPRGLYLNNEVGPVWSYVLRITPDTSNNTAHTVDDLFVPQMLRWMRVCGLVYAVGRGT